MKTLVVGNQKGGVGKTAVAVHIAFFLAEKGYSVAFVDADTQGNSSSSLGNAVFSELTAFDLFRSKPIKAKPQKGGIVVFKGDDNLAQVDRFVKVASVVGLLLPRFADLVQSEEHHRPLVLQMGDVGAEGGGLLVAIAGQTQRRGLFGRIGQDIGLGSVVAGEVGAVVRIKWTECAGSEQHFFGLFEQRLLPVGVLSAASGFKQGATLEKPVVIFTRGQFCGAIIEKQ